LIHGSIQISPTVQTQTDFGGHGGVVVCTGSLKSRAADFVVTTHLTSDHPQAPPNCRIISQNISSHPNKRQTENEEETLHRQTDMLRTTIARTLRVNRIVMLRPYSEGATGSGTARPGGEAAGFVIRFSTFDRS